MTTLIDFHFDFETRSHLDLTKVGTVRYATHPSTEVTLLTWSFGRTGAVKEWNPSKSIPDDLLDVINNPHKYHFIAFNIIFDYLIWIIPFSRQIKINIPKPLITNITDCAALSLNFRSGGSLASCAKILNIPMKKDPEGRKIMLKLCKPSSKTGEYSTVTKEEWDHFVRYGIIDTMILREAYYKLPKLPAAERWIFEWNFIRNLTGIRVDTYLLRVMDDIVSYNLPILEKEFASLTGGLKVKSVKAKDFFVHYFPWIKDMKKDTVRDMMLERHTKHPQVSRALEIKSLAGSSSIAKVSTAIDQMFNGRIYTLLEYSQAQTKRFAGRGVQIHNFPRPVEGADKLPELNTDNLAEVVYKRANSLIDPIGFVKNLLRRIWLADEGEILYCGDFSKVEPTVLWWLVGMGPIPKLAYEEMAANIYAKPIDQISSDSEERQVGKAAVLAGGYGMGHEKFRDDVYSKTGIQLTKEFSKHTIDTYRKVNKPIADFWKDLQSAFRKAIHGEVTSLCSAKVHVMPMEHPYKGVKIRLPSGTYLYYHHAYAKVEVETVEVVEIINNVPMVRLVQRTSENIYYVVDMGQGRTSVSKLYGGLLCEHVTSATARDLLCHSMYQLEQRSFKVLTTIHDEIWGSSHPGRDKEFEETMCIKPHWAEGLELTTDSKNGIRYLK